MAFWNDWFKTKQINVNYQPLTWRINPAGDWIYPEATGGNIINKGYKSLPNVYSIISLVLGKSTIVPYELYRVKNTKHYRQYQSRIKNKDIAGALIHKAQAFDLIEDKDTEIDDLLNNPNSYQSRSELLWDVDGYKLLTGNSILWKFRLSEDGDVKELHSIPSPFVELKVKGNQFEPELFYKINNLSELQEAKDIVHFKYWNPVSSNLSHRYWGNAPLSACSKLLGRYSDADSISGYMFQNAGASGILTADKGTNYSQSQFEQIKDQFKKQRSGLDKVGNIIMGSQPMSWTQIGLSPVDLNIISAKKEILGELCNIFNVPIALFSEANSTENNMIESRKSLITDAVIPLVEARKQVEQREIIDEFGEDIIIEYDYSIFNELSEDLDKVASTAEKMWWITPNERRVMTNFDRVDNPDMDKVYAPTGLAPLEDLTFQLPEVDLDDLN